MESGFLTAVTLDSLDDLIALLPETVHLDDLLGWVLQIAVEHDAAVTAGLFKPGKHRSFLAEVSAEADAADPGILVTGSTDLRPGAVL